MTTVSAWPMTELGSRMLDANLDVLVGVGGSLPGWRSHEDALAAAGQVPPASDSTEMFYSSGTTGRPKAVRRPVRADAAAAGGGPRKI